MILAILLASVVADCTAACAVVSQYRPASAYGSAVSAQAQPDKPSCGHGPVSARQWLDAKLDPCLKAELPALGKPRPRPYAPAAPQGDDLELWPKVKLVPAPVHDDVLLERLPGTLQ